MKSADIVIIGGGIVGLAIGRQILLDRPTLKVAVLEKEPHLAEHASGRNSGVLHAGFYYNPDSLKARLTRRGNVLLHQFCEDRGEPIRKSGKVVVASSAAEVATLLELQSRATANDVPVELINESELTEIEPLARTFEQALWSPTTSVSSPAGVTKEIAKEFTELGGHVQLDTRVLSVQGTAVTTNHDTISAGHVINCAGLYADVFARQAGLNDDYVMLPFKGLYWYAPSLKGTLRSHIYPVPNVANPFLGVHFTVTVDGDVKVGPTAIPALWREDYGGVGNFNFSEAVSVASSYPRFLTSRHHNVPKLIRSEVPKYSRRFLLAQAKTLAPDIPARAFTKKGRTGVRAQLLHKKSGRLEMDFILRGQESSTHVLNAVSPAWTTSLAVAEYVTEDLARRGIL